MFKLVSQYKPTGDQPLAIKKLVNTINKGKDTQQVLLGATGTGKTFTIANVIEKTQKKTLVIAHNKTLVAQLYGELKSMFPENKVEYFVSYFDFYTPEAYIPRSDTYIEKSAQANQEIEMMRLSTINSLANDKDVIVVASVASIYASISPDDFETFKIIIKVGEKKNLRAFQYELARLLYTRNDVELTPGTFRSKGDIFEIMLGHSDEYKLRISFFGEEIEEICTVDSLENKVIEKHNVFIINPANEYIMNKDRLNESIVRIKKEANSRVEYFTKNNKLLEAQRLKERVEHDIESLLELGYCNGIENYSRHLELRKENQTPYTLFDFFNKDEWLLVIDESHMTLPQITGMYNGDRSRKQTLVEYGFRLPSALDNRPLNFEEFNSKIKTAIYVSATPNNYEIEKSEFKVVEQIVRPTGLLDPTLEIRKEEKQIDDLLKELKIQKEKNERTFICVLTISMAEELTNFLIEKGVKAAYMHSELKTIERTKILNDLRRGKYECIVGINLLREGLDVPEVSLVSIFNANKPGFFRSYQALVQTFGRAARNVNGRVIMYGDSISDAMKKAIEETNRRRDIQISYNEKNKITPKTIIKPIKDLTEENDMKQLDAYFKKGKKKGVNKEKLLKNLKKDMLTAAKNKNYEEAIKLRDIIIELEGNEKYIKED